MASIIFIHALSKEATQEQLDNEIRYQELKSNECIPLLIRMKKHLKSLL